MQDEKDAKEAAWTCLLHGDLGDPQKSRKTPYLSQLRE
jgi:hypothetical protein